jgi:preprotein translocase subunit SecY
MRSTAARLAVTLLLPLLIVIGGNALPLPGMADLLDSLTRTMGDAFSVDRTNVSVFALGMTPVIEAYAAVELVAFLVPRWSRLRHGNPEGRAKLDRASRILAIVFAAFQAFAVAQSLAALGRGSGAMLEWGDVPSVPIVVATLVGGVCVQIVVAEGVSRQRIANGYILLTVVQAIARLRASVVSPMRTAMHLGTIEPKHFVLLFLVLALPAVATWMALRGADLAHGVAPAPSGVGPYRQARELALAPWVPVPASGIAPFALASALLAFPATLVLALGIQGPARDLAGSLAGARGYGLAMVVLTGILVLIFAAQLHRPREMADVASRVGFAGGPELATKAHETLSATLAPTLLFFATLLGASSLSGTLPVHPEILFVPLSVALVMDMAVGVRTSGMVPVWEERRASAVPVVRAVLAAEGIHTEVGGLGVLSLLQVVAPYAPAEILVAEADAERATALLRHVFRGEKRSEPEPATDTEPPGAITTPWTPRRRVIGLVATTSIALLSIVAANVTPSATAAPSGGRARLEVVRVDDSVDVFERLRDADLPPGIEIRSEDVPIGRGNRTKTYFARTRTSEGEPYEGAVRRMRAWCDELPLREGNRIALEAIEDRDPATDKPHRVGVRTFVLAGAPVLTTDDVVEAVPALNPSRGIPGAYVAVTLSPAGSERFRAATGSWVERRIAILVDDVVASAPVVKTEIGGGRITVTMGAGDPEEQLVQAKALARALSIGR